MASPILMPRSRVHALVQITLCIILFRLRPDLLPRWYFFPLTLLVVAAVALIVTLARGGGRLARSAAKKELRPPKPVIVVDASDTRPKAAPATRAVGVVGDTLLSRIGRVVQRLVDRARRFVATLIDRVHRAWSAGSRAARAVHDRTRKMRSDRRALRLQLEVLAGRIPHVAWTWTVRCLRWLVAEVIYILTHDFRTDIPRRHRLFGIRRELESGIEMAAAVVRSTWRHFIWLCLCTMHFLAFTLGLTIIFPCLCAYGLVVSCIHLILSHGTRNLTRGAVSYFM